MNSQRAKRIEDAIQRYDRNLFLDGNNIMVKTIRGSKMFVIALTNTWNHNGVPVEWGLEPIMAQLRSMDAWRYDGIYKDLVDKREREERISKQSYSNDMKARAMDLRRDFAKATNDINTSTL